MLIGEMCQVIAMSTAPSLSSFVWRGILYLWPWKWILIVLAIGGWTAWEIVTRNGNYHYNSKNGFSPTFNSFVGSGTFLLFQSVLLLVFEKIIGGNIYCMVWPYVVHLFIFISTGLFLHFIGFWPELRIFNTKKRRRKY